MLYPETTQSEVKIQYWAQKKKYNIGLADNIKLIKFLNLYSDCHTVSCQNKSTIENLQLTYF